jgi:hypothetical protein
MTYACVTGTASCAMFSIGWFKGGKEINENYQKDPKSFKYPDGGMPVSDFSNKVLLPTSQPVGRTYDLPFTKLMEDISSTGLDKKLIWATLNQAQFVGDDGYWRKELEKHGFKLMCKTKNNWGSVNYMFARNPAEIPILEGETS